MTPHERSQSKWRTAYALLVGLLIGSVLTGTILEHAHLLCHN